MKYGAMGAVIGSRDGRPRTVILCSLAKDGMDLGKCERSVFFRFQPTFADRLYSTPHADSGVLQTNPKRNPNVILSV